jgi:hypothetical protein
MKKILVIFLPIMAFSDLNMCEVNSVLLNIHASKELKYYSSDINISIDKKIKFTSLDDADILLFPKKTDIQKNIDNKIAIVGSYQELKDNNNSIGAIYLKKDRTQIIFIKERLENKGLTLEKKFNKYIVPLCYLTTDCL